MSSLDPITLALSSSWLWISFQDQHLGCQLFSRGEVAKSWKVLTLKVTAQITFSEREVSKMTVNQVKMLIVTWGVFRC